MKTQANKLFLFRDMPETVNVEISQVPATKEGLKKACSLFQFTANDNVLTIVVLKDAKGCKISSSLNNETYTDYSDYIPVGNLSSVLTGVVHYSLNLA